MRHTISYDVRSSLMPELIDDVVRAMQERLDSLQEPERRHFLGTYLRTTAAVGNAVRDAFFEDPEWVERWDVAFARLYLDALDAYLSGAGRVPRPWRGALRGPARPPRPRPV